MTVPERRRQEREQAVFGWLSKLKRAPPPPEARWSVAVDTDSIRVTDDAGATRALAKADLSDVIIETNDSGPWGADLWWLLFGGDDALGCAFPMGATGETKAVDYLTALPGFDHGAMIRAMSSTANARFPVWSRAGALG